MQLEMYEHKLKEDIEYSAMKLSDILKWIDKPFRAMNDTEKEKDRYWLCDFKPRKKYVYDRKIKEFRKIDVRTMSFLKVGRERYRVDQVKDVESYPRITLRRLP